MSNNIVVDNDDLSKKENEFYDNIIYKFSENKENNKTNYSLIFQDDPHSKYFISFDLTKKQFNILDNIIYEENRACNDLNIANIVLLIEAAQMVILYSFITIENKKPSIRFSLFSSIKRENLLILDFDIVTGLSLVHMMKLPLSITKELYSCLKKEEKNV